MVRKIVHGIDTCEDCNRIFLLFLNLDSHSIRFNALLGLCQKSIDPKYSAPRLQRHLEGLKGKFLKRIEEEHQKVIYTLIIPEVDLDLGRLDLERRVEILRKVPLDQIIDRKIMIIGVMFLGHLILDIESLLNRHTPQERSYKLLLMQSMINNLKQSYDLAMTERTKSEYSKVLKSLKDERSQLIKRLGSTH